MTCQGGFQLLITVIRFICRDCQRRFCWIVEVGNSMRSLLLESSLNLLVAGQSQTERTEVER